MSPSPVSRTIDQRNQLVTANLGLAVHWATAAAKRTDRVELCDLIGAAQVGLIRAADKFNPSHSRFSTYATFWIRYYLAEEIRRSGPVHLPQSAHRLQRKSARDPSTMPSLVIERLTAARQPAEELDDEIPDPESDPTDPIYLESLRDIVAGHLEVLEPDEKAAIESYFEFPEAPPFHARMMAAKMRGLEHLKRWL